MGRALWRYIIDSDFRLLYRSKLFDVGWYLSQGVETKARRGLAVTHYLKTGSTHGLDPHPLFDTAWYVSQYGSVIERNNPLVDYLRNGAFVGRNPNPWFDSEWYLSQYYMLMEPGCDPLTDYINTGWKSARNPHPNFDTRWYLSNYIDVAKAGYEPLSHFLCSGQAEGRRSAGPERAVAVISPPRTTSSDPRHVCRDFNFMSSGLARRVISIRGLPEEFDDCATYVYTDAKKIIEEQQIERVVDIGVRGQPKAAESIYETGAEIWLAGKSDQKPLRPSARKMEVNIEDINDLERFESSLTNVPTLLIIRYALELVQDPRPLLRTLRRILRQHPANRLLFTTLQGNSSGAYGLSPELLANFVRFWSADEFAQLITASGFELICQEVVTSFQIASVVSQLSCADSSYQAFLKRSGLPNSGLHLVLTTEHALTESSSGIGSLHHRRLDIGIPHIILYCGNKGLPLRWFEFVSNHGWLHIADLCGRGWQKKNNIASVAPDDVLDAVLQAIFIYDEIAIIEYQDFLGVGSRIAQAKRAGMIPQSITVFAYAHGTHFYLDLAEGSLPKSSNLLTEAYERVGLEQADCVVFPSKYLKSVIVDIQGLALRAERVQPYPLRFEPQKNIVSQMRTIDTLIFYGRQSVRKGYEDFCQALIKLCTAPEYNSFRLQLKTVIMMGVEKLDSRLSSLEGLTIRCGIYAYSEAISILCQSANRSVVVLPYKGDNQPLSLFETVECGADWIAYSAGGIPELIPNELAPELLCEPGVETLAAAINRVFARTLDARRDIKLQTLLHFSDLTRRWVDDYRTMIKEFLEARSEFYKTRSDITVIVPNFNGPARFFDDLKFGLVNSYFAPARTIIVDDGSTVENLEVARRAAVSIPNCTVHPTSHGGLSAARNIGLALTNSPLVCFHDNDNIVCNQFLDVAETILTQNPDVAVVTSWNTYFRDGSNWTLEDYESSSYRPIGQDMGLGLSDNIFGDALALYRTDVLKAFGGWDESTEAMWEDWELFVRLTSAGYRIWVIPTELFLYRQSEASMSRKYSRFCGGLRLQSAFPNLPKAEAISLSRAMLSQSKSL